MAERKFERIDPKILQSILLEEVAGRLADVTKLLAQTIPQGIVEAPAQTVYGAQFQTILAPTPWFNVSIYNDADSASSIYVAINKQSADLHEVKPDDTYNVNMGAAKIKVVYIKSVAGGSATYRITAVR